MLTRTTNPYKMFSIFPLCLWCHLLANSLPCLCYISHGDLLAFLPSVFASGTWNVCRELPLDICIIYSCTSFTSLFKCPEKPSLKTTYKLTQKELCHCLFPLDIFHSIKHKLKIYIPINTSSPHKSVSSFIEGILWYSLLYVLNYVDGI